MNLNFGLINAKVFKRDEFYTSFSVVKAELNNYISHFAGKTIYCPCDSPFESAFVDYFYRFFSELKLNRFIATSYSDFDNGMLFDMDCNGKFIIRHLDGNGDFRSDECIDYLKQADIVATNPPFSLFREFISLLVEHDKYFIVLGNQNAVTCKEILPLIRDNKMWYGASIHSGDREFRVPRSYPLNAQGIRLGDGNIKYIRVKGVRWFTNLDYPGRYNCLKLSARYNPIRFPKYDFYDAIEVSRTRDIPRDYYGVMGVPISFLDYYDPEQFEILGDNRFHDGSMVSSDINYINGVQTYRRLLIRRKM